MADPEDTPEPPKPRERPRVYTSIAGILPAITPENIQPLCDFGSPVGAELL